MQKPKSVVSRSKYKIRSPLERFWHCLTDTKYWSDSNLQIIEIRRSEVGVIDEGETFEVVSQYEKGDPISIERLTVRELTHFASLELEGSKVDVVFDIQSSEKAHYLVITTRVEPSLLRWLFLVFGLTEAKITKDSFIRGIDRVAKGLK